MTLSRHVILDHHPKEQHDPRSIERFHIARFISEVPTRGKYWTPPPWRLDQLNTGHCGGFASTNEAGASPFRQKFTGDPNEYAHQFYYRAKEWKLDPWGLEEGTSTLAMLKVGQRLGHWENYAWARTVDDLKRNLEAGPFLFGVPYMTGMFSPDKYGIVHATGVEEGGHLMCAFGWSPNWYGRGPMLYLAQSWGAEFGDNGIIRIPMDEAGWLLARGEAGSPVSRKLIAA